MSNRLADEPSPYLQQHAENPVDWYPWGEEAFEMAQAEDRPILLSIGYSSCHWCHVMAHESFEDPRIAEAMNEGFVNVKVDREERPDVDSIYMKAVQSMTGQGGWPLTVFLTPEKVPFYGGTYFPPEPRQGMPSFERVLEATRSAYEERRDEVEKAAGKLAEALERSARAQESGSGEYGPEGRAPDSALLKHAETFASERFDAVHGGFGSAPKFPQPPTLDFLLRRSRGRDDASSLQMVEHTLRRMARGGIRDHLGGGFHRYSVDQRWHVPHFEKMLYDNALLGRLYVDGWRATGDAEFRAVAAETLEWLLDELRAPQGAFYAALDADTEGEEGRYYVWDAEEIDTLLPAGEAETFRAFYGIEHGGNWEGTNVLHQPRDPGEVARDLEIEPDALERRLASARETLRERRDEREHPFRDEKVLTGWNGLAIRTLAEAGAAMKRPGWVEAAREAADFLLEALRPDGELLHVWKDGEARVGAFLDDYGALGTGLLALHEATLEPRWLEEAHGLLEGLQERFWDPDGELLYDVSADAQDLPVRPRDPMDNPAPSGTSLATELLLRSAVLFGDDGCRERAARVLAREAGAMERYPLAFGALLSALDFHISGAVEVAVVGPVEDDAGTAALLGAAHASYLPARILTGRSSERTPEVPVPLLEGREMRDGRATAYVCRNYACREPVSDVEALEAQLRRAADELTA